MSQRRLVVDVETGGLDPAIHSILEVGFAVIDGDQVVDRFYVYVNEPNITLTAGAMEANQIEMLQIWREGYAPQQAVEAILKFMRKWGFYDKVVLVGANVKFDVGFLQRLWRLGGRNYDSTFSHRTIDVQSIGAALNDAGRLVLPSISLSSLCSILGVQNREAHEAMADAVATAEVYLKQLEMLRPQ